MKNHYLGLITIFLVFFANGLSSSEVEGALHVKRDTEKVVDLEWLKDIARAPQLMASGLMKGIHSIRGLFDHFSTAFGSLSNDLNLIVQGVTKESKKSVASDNEAVTDIISSTVPPPGTKADSDDVSLSSGPS